jgi:hypothetical protein
MGASWVWIVMPAVPALLILSYLHLRWKKNSARDWTAWTVSLALALSPMGIAFAAQSHFIWGVIYGACVYVGIIAFSLRALNRIGPLAVIAALVAAGAAVIIVVPAAILPRIHVDLHAGRQDEQSFAELDLRFVEKSLDTMRSSMDSTMSSIEAEKKNMSAAIEKLSAGLTQRNRQLGEINEKHRRLQQEVEQYKALANLTEAQAAAVIAALERGKYLEYLVGFVLGVASSITATFVSRVSRLISKS